MTKKSKHPKLPNGFGTIKWLGKKRRNPYGVYPPVQEFKDGVPETQKALCYVDEWIVGFAVLTSYHAGTYEPGIESTFKEMYSKNSSLSTEQLAERILADYNRRMSIQKEENKKTFSEVYEKFFDWKFNGKKQYSDASKNSTRAAYNNCKSLHDKPYDEITYQDMQNLVDNCTLKHSSIELIVSLLKQMAKFAKAEKIIPDMGNVELLRINIDDDDEHGVPFSDDELKKIWNDSRNEVVEILLIMCYSGHRIGELHVIEVDLNENFFSGGLKTRASKERIVPIHSAILPIVKRRIKKYGRIMSCSDSDFRNMMYEYLKNNKMDKHTPHDCRHTFSRLCEVYGVRENDRKRMLGHKIGDITNDIYGHRQIDELRKEIEKIKVCC